MSHRIEINLRSPIADEVRRAAEAAGLDVTTTPSPERLLKERARVPTKAQFEVGQYDDGSGPVATISYDASSVRTPTIVWVEVGSNWVAFDWQHADEIADTIKLTAAALRSLAEEGEGE